MWIDWLNLGAVYLGWRRAVYRLSFIGGRLTDSDLPFPGGKTSVGLSRSRGIVAAAVFCASFALKLQSGGVAQAELVPLRVALVIIGTVAIQSATAGIPARRLAGRAGATAIPG